MKKDRTKLLFVICVLIPSLALITHCVLWLCDINRQHNKVKNKRQIQTTQNLSQDEYIPTPNTLVIEQTQNIIIFNQ